MWQSRTVAALLFWLLGTAPLETGPKLTIRVSPRICMARCDVAVSVWIARHAENRSLSVAADSGAYGRASGWTLDGDRSPQTYRVEWKGLPTGEYVIEAVLRGPREVRATTQTALVVTGP